MKVFQEPGERGFRAMCVDAPIGCHADAILAAFACLAF